MGSRCPGAQNLEGQSTKHRLCPVKRVQKRLKEEKKPPDTMSEMELFVEGKKHNQVRVQECTWGTAKGKSMKNINKAVAMIAKSKYSL